MMKKVLLNILILFSFSISIVHASEFDITSDYVILYNLNDDSVIYEENSEEKTSIASLTKMMTTIVAIENITDFNEIVEIKARDFEGTNGYSKAGFVVGDKVTYLDLLYGIMLPSGGEAANAVSYNLTGDLNKFVDLMNAKAKELNLTNTKFANPIGKDDIYNYSTAKDVATLLKYALTNDIFKQIFTTKEYTVKSTNLKLESTLINYGKLFDISLIKGSKSGFTKGAGRCLASISTINGVDYLLVVIKSDASQNFNAVKDTLTVYNYYGNNYGYKNLIANQEIVKNIPIKNGKEKVYEIRSNKDISLYLKNDVNIDYEYEGIEELNSDIAKGDMLGKLKFYNNDDVIYTMDLYLDQDISYYHPSLYCLIGFITLIILFLIFRLFRKKAK